MRKAIVFFSFVISALSALANDNPDAGKAIFQSQCTSCHAIASKLVGPALKDVDKRHSIAWIIKFVTSSQGMVKSGDKQAVQVFEENNEIVMPDHLTMTAADISNVISYIKQQESIVSAAPQIAKPAENHPSYKPISFSNYFFWAIYFLSVAFMIGIFIHWTRVVDFLKSNR